MTANLPQQNYPINFFMSGGQYISDNFNMKIIDTSSPNAFENLDLTTIKPDMLQEYINSEKPPENNQKESKGFFDSISDFFKN